MKIGILGGGQLGKLFIEKSGYNGDIYTYSPTKPLSANTVWVQGALDDEETIFNFAKTVDILTIEIEAVNIPALYRVQKELGKQVYPDPKIIETISDKLSQKNWLLQHQFPTAKLLESPPGINKLRFGGYDGRGVKYVTLSKETFTAPSFIEEYIDIKKELSVIVGRNKNGEMAVIPPVEVVSKNYMMDYLLCPANVPEGIEALCRELAYSIATTFELCGILAIELFLDINNNLWVNEMAPRPHNTGHHSTLSCTLNQHQLLLKCLLNKPLPLCHLKQPDDPVLSLNIIGERHCNTPRLHHFEKLDEVEWYGKAVSRSGRKMGHINTYLPKTDMATYIDRLKTALRVQDLPKVSVIMGSSSDFPIVCGAISILQWFKVDHEVQIVSAHRTPEQMIKWAGEADNRGIQVIIAAAGGAAHLPGMVASVTTLPVIGIPIKSKKSIDGWDSLLSIVQMPSGIPVGTMSVDGSENAGLYAVRILSINNPRLKNLLYDYKKSLQKKVEMQNVELLYS